MQQYTAKVITIDFAPKRLGTNGKNNIKKDNIACYGDYLYIDIPIFLLYTL